MHLITKKYVITKKYNYLDLENSSSNPYRNLKSVAVETRSALEKLYANYKSEVSII